MDFQYNFRQSHLDRLEDAGVHRYQHVEGVELDTSDNTPQQSIVRRIRLIITTILTIFIR